MGYPAPYISFVATARNDNHGGDLLVRMQVFITALLRQLKKFKIPSELILVEWNPPKDRPPLAQALSWPRDTGPCTVRIIQVPPELHSRFKHSDRLPLFQMIAKNVGIRRSRGQFVLATNIDLLFSDELMDFIAKRKLDQDAVYRIDRWDVPKDIPKKASIKRQMDYCKQSVLRVCVTGGIITIPKGKITDGHLFFRIIHLSLRRVFLSLSPLYSFFLWLRPWIPTKRRLLILKTRQGWIRVYNHLKIPFQRNTRQLGHGEITGSSRRGKKNSGSSLFKGYRPHFVACGDFTLLSRDRWFRICGYPEWEVFSMHLDSVGLYAAYLDGAPQIVLKSPMRIYHIEHESGWSPERDAEMYGRIEKLGIPALTIEDVYSCFSEMRSGRYSYCTGNWGLEGDDLPEITPRSPQTKHEKPR